MSIPAAPRRRRLPSVVALAVSLWLASCSESSTPRAEPDDGGATTPVTGTADVATQAPVDDEPSSPPDDPTADTGGQGGATDGPSMAEEVTDTAAPALPDISDWQQVEGHLGQHRLAWRPIDHDKVPRNVEFSMDVVILRGDEPLTDGFLQVTGYMPDHGHGMVQMPLGSEVGGGRYRVDGMLLHMRGFWTLRFEVIFGGRSETFTFEMTL